jgi:hypothetical protein
MTFANDGNLVVTFSLHGITSFMPVRNTPEEVDEFYLFGLDDVRIEDSSNIMHVQATFRDVRENEI